MTGLGQPLDVVRRMTLPQVNRLFGYWRGSPPVHELLAMLARVYTTWTGSPDTIADQQAAGAMSPADFFEHFKRTGGKVAGMSPLPGA